MLFKQQPGIGIKNDLGGFEGWSDGKRLIWFVNGKDLFERVAFAIFYLNVQGKLKNKMFLVLPDGYFYFMTPLFPAGRQLWMTWLMEPLMKKER